MALLVWALLLAPSVGCGADADRGGRGVSPMEDQLGDPEVYWRHQDERRGAEQTMPAGSTLAPKTVQE